MNKPIYLPVIGSVSSLVILESISASKFYSCSSTPMPTTACL